jgi:hypothetical protein
MNGQDPMLGSADEQKAYRQQITDMIQQDVEQRRAQRIAEFQNSRQSRAVILGMTGTADGFSGAVNE